MIDTGDVRKGSTLDIDGKLVKVIDFSHNKQGRGSAQLRMSLKDLRTGSNTQVTVMAGTKFQSVRLERQHVQFLYREGTHFHFMDTETYDQLSFPPEILGTAMQYLLPNSKVMVMYVGDKPVSVDVPASIDLTVTDTPPSLKGATATNQYKEATLETGLKIQVPPFIGPGEKIRIDTRTGEYIERVK